jgi:aldehyde:ferredoxin oxidoreductase
MIRGEHGEKSKALLIGPAAENQARIAVISSDSNVAFGQGGFGGVMGSKNLKAIVVRGTKGLEVAHPTYLAEIYSQLEFLMKGTKTMSDDPGERIVGVGGWSDYSKNTKLYEYVIEGKAEWWYDSCFACHVCKYEGGTSRISISFNDESIPSGASHCVEYGMYIPPEQLYYGGKMYGKVSAEASHLVDMLGINAWEVYFTTRGFDPDPRETQEGGRRMDTLGGLNLLYQLYKGGVLNEKNTGLPFSKFGSREFILDLLHKIAYREGFGNLLAEGLPRALHYMMENPEEFDITEDQIKEIELAYKQGFPRSGGFGGYPRHHLFCGGQGCGYLYHPQVLRCCIDPNDFSTLHTNTRILRILGIEYASDEYWEITGPIAKKWMGSPKAFDQYTTDYKAEAAHHGMRMAMELDCLPLCDFRFPLWFSNHTPDRIGDDEVGSKLFYAVTGIKKTQEELYEMVDPIWDLERAIACREGRRKKDDWLHDHEFQGMDLEGRYLTESDLRNLLDQLYTFRGWDLQTGVPTKQRLEKIGLKDVAQELDEMGFY